MNVRECIDTLIAGKFRMNDSCKLNEVVSTITFDKDDFRIRMYYGNEEPYMGKVELLLFDMSNAWYTDVAATFDKSDCPYKNIDKKKFLDIVYNTASLGDMLKKFHNYEMNRLLKKL